MNFKFLFCTTLFLLQLLNVDAQTSDRKIVIGLESQLLVVGEFNASYNFLFGANAAYYFKEFNKLKPYLSFGISSNGGPNHARMLAANLSLGADFILSKRINVSAQVGFQYVNERQSLLFVDARHDWNNIIYGGSARLGVNFSLSNDISTNIFFKQINLSAGSVGLGFSYSF